MTTKLHYLLTPFFILVSWNGISGSDLDRSSLDGELPEKSEAIFKLCHRPWIPKNVSYTIRSPYPRWFQDRYLPGTSLYFTCGTYEHTLVGQSSMYCGEDGNWIPKTPPVCFSRKSCSNPVIENGIWKCVKDKCGQSLRSGTKIKIICDNGATLQGNSMVKCSQGRWSPELPTCSVSKKRCPALAPVTNGSFRCVTERCMEFGVETMLTVKCDTGYFLTSGGTLYCRPDGTWSSKLPKCMPSSDKFCGMPFNIEHGEWEFNKYDVNSYNSFGTGAVVSYRCDKGYRLSGNQELICQDDGQWSGFPPTCDIEVRCPVPGPVNDGRFKCAVISGLCRDYNVGVRLVLVCDEGYQRQGDSSMECMDDGQWSGEKPSCSKIPSHAVVSSPGAFRNTTTVVIATACSVLGVLMVLMLVVVIIHRRRPSSSQLVHQIHPPPPAYSQTYTPPTSEADPDQNHDRLALIAYDGISLPSYDEVVSTNHHRPTRVHRPVDSASRQSLVTNSTVNRDGLSAFGSLDTVNQSSANVSTHASTDNTSTSVTVETYDSGASVPSIAMSSRRAVAGSLASTSDTSSVHKEESPLLEPEPEFPTSSQDVEMEDFKID